MDSRNNGIVVPYIPIPEINAVAAIKFNSKKFSFIALKFLSKSNAFVKRFKKS